MHLWDVHIGFDQREVAAYSVARESLRKFHRHISVKGVVLSDLHHRKMYYRPTEKRLGRFYDEISKTETYNGQLATEFAISRFLVPEIVKRMDEPPYGWSLFMDCDVLVRGSLSPMMDNLDDSKAVYVVKHDYQPALGIKMDGCRQTAYPRKNWSSVMVFNVGHPANEALTVEMVNTLPGRDLHAFKWLSDDLIGELDPKYNYLVGDGPRQENPVIAHFTNGCPDLHGFTNCHFADEWRAELEQWAA